MPGGKRTDRISPRDLEVLEFIARLGVAPRSAVALWGDFQIGPSQFKPQRSCEAVVIDPTAKRPAQTARIWPARAG